MQESKEYVEADLALQRQMTQSLDQRMALKREQSLVRQHTLREASVLKPALQ